MPPASFIPGAAQPAPLLARLARPSLIPPENWIGARIFPDVEAPSFYGLAPVASSNELDVADDDTIAPRADYREITFEDERPYDFELGARARRVVITRDQKEKAKIAQRFMVEGDAIQDLEVRGLNLVVAQHARRAELLKNQELQNTDNYPEDNVFPSIEIDTITVANFLKVLRDATRVIGSAQRGAATDIVFANDAWDGALMNPLFEALLPDTAYKIMDPQAFLPILTKPIVTREGQPEPTISIADSYYRTKKKGALVPMFSGHIWVGRTGVNGFGRGYWHKPEETEGKSMWGDGRLYVNRISIGNQENISIGAFSYDRPVVNDGALGVLIPVTVSGA